MMRTSRVGWAMMRSRYVLSALALALSPLLSCDTNGPAGGGPVDPDPGLTGPAPFITEFVARNQGGLKDEDGAASDWIEIYNPGSAPFDLGGYHLTDTQTNPTRWTFPAGTVVQPGAYLVVFASGKDRTVVGKPLHTNFSLAGGDRGDSCLQQSTEYLAITNKSGTPVQPEWNPYPTQTPDVSYGLLAANATATRAFFATPTPGAANNAASALAERVTFNPASRTFGTGTPLEVSLAVTSPTATVRYTTNRSRPIGKAGIAGTFMADGMTDVCTLAAHGLTSGELVRVTGPAPLQNTVNYFAVVLTPDTFKLAMEPGGPGIDLTAGGSFELRRDAATGTAATTDIITTSFTHTFFTGDPVQVTTSAGGTLPAPLTAGTTYYVVYGAPNQFRLSTTANGMSIVDITTAGTGTLITARTPSPAFSAPISLTLNTRIRARAFEPGRPDGPLGSEMYFAIDAAAQQLTSNLPLVLTHTWNAAMANDTPVDGQIMVFEPKPPDNLARLTNPPDLASPSRLERRGSSTANDPKFSMAVELQDENGRDQNCSPFGMPANADWVMHAPYSFDRSMMHNDLIYRISNDSGRYAPRTRLIEHIHNEQSMADTIEGSLTGTDYFGVYSFMEKITRDKDRVDVENLTLADNTAPNVQGGYMFKVDRLDTGENGIRPLAGQSFGNAGFDGPGNNILAWVNPREISPDPFKVATAAQRTYIAGHIGEAWGVLAGPSSADPVNGYAKYWDIPAMVEHHIFNVATKNPDALRLSSYWHKPRNGKLTPGPIWDFDRCEGSTDGRDFDWGTWTAGGGTDFFNYPWYREMFLDPNFWQAWIDRYHQLRQGTMSTPAINTRIDEFASLVNPGDAAGTPAKRSAVRWPNSIPRAVGSNTGITNNTFNGQYTGEVAWLKYWWQQRLNFMDSQLTRPAVADLPRGKVAAGSRVTLTSPSQSLPNVKIYYTTDGSDPRWAAVAGPSPPANVKEYTAPIPITGAVRLYIRTWNPAPVAPVRSGWSAPTIIDYTL